MSEQIQTESVALGPVPVERVSHLAAKALTVVAERQRKAFSMVQAHFVEMLQDAAVSSEHDAIRQVVTRMRDASISSEEIADFYIPAVARRLGDQWCEDQVGFATVTIGVARLQGLLREVGPEWRADRMSDGNAPGLLVVVAAGIYHTLGAMVLTGMMRRRGLSVRLMIGAEPDMLGPVLRQARFDAVFISSSEGETFESLRKLVAAIKSSTATPPPVVIGGTILETAREVGADVLHLTSADFATSDPNEALTLCELHLETRDGVDCGQGY